MINTKYRCKQILEYAKSPCIGVKIEPSAITKLPNEAHVAVWKKYLEQDAPNDLLKLQQAIGQFNIPIREGISQTEAYAAVVKRGENFSEKFFAERFSLRKPGLFHCYIYDHPAGALPVLYTQNREDFKDLFRMGGYRSEPVRVNASINALMVSGLTNWQRVFTYRDQWLGNNKSGLLSVMGWANEMQRVLKHQAQLFKDRFVIVMKAPYSSVDVSETDLDFSLEDWLEASLRIRLEHEFTHYAVKRIFNVMRSHVWDEVLADFMGITCALNNFYPALFLRFLGLDAKGHMLPKARITHYVQDLSPDLVEKVCKLLVDVSSGLAKFYLKQSPNGNRMKLLFDLSRLSLIEMAEQ